MELNQKFRQLITLVCESIADFRSYDLSRIAVSIGRSRSRSKNGLWAYVVPLRYIGGKSERRGLRWGIPGTYTYDCEKIIKQHPQARYLMTFLCPRFFYLSLEERMETLVHELYHLHPTMRGDLRRFAPPYRHHGPTPAAYDRQVKKYMQEAYSYFPELKNHPLLQLAEKDFKELSSKRFSIPKRVFRPFGQQNLFGLRSLLVFLALSATGVQAQASKKTKLADLFKSSTKKQKVKKRKKSSTKKKRAAKKKSYYSNQPGKFYEQASTNAKITGYYESGERMGLVKKSPKGSWLYLKDKDFYAWAFARDFRPYKNKSKEDIKIIPKTEEWKADKTQYFIKEDTKFFENPTKFSEQSGVLLKDDEVEVLETSKNGQWIMIHLPLTGDKGWLPKKLLISKTAKGVKRSGPFAVDLLASYGSHGHKLGLGIFGSYNFLSQGLGFDPRARMEIGLLFSLWQGESFNISGQSLKASYQMSALMFRYVSAFDRGRINVAVQLGGAYRRADISSSLSATIINSLQLARLRSGLGALMGLAAWWSLNPKLLIGLHWNLYLAGYAANMGGAQLTFRF